MFSWLEDGLTNPALSSLYLDYCSIQSESSVTDMLNYLQEHEKIQKRKGQGKKLILRQEDPMVDRLLAMMERMANRQLPVIGRTLCSLVKPDLSKPGSRNEA